MFELQAGICGVVGANCINKSCQSDVLCCCLGGPLSVESPLSVGELFWVVVFSIKTCVPAWTLQHSCTTCFVFKNEERKCRTHLKLSTDLSISAQIDKFLVSCCSWGVRMFPFLLGLLLWPCGASNDSECPESPSLLQAHSNSSSSKKRKGPEYWLQIATAHPGPSSEGECWTNQKIYAQVKGHGKSTGWGTDLARQVTGTNFRSGDRVIYQLSCWNSDCPSPDEVEEICLKMSYTRTSDRRWCPVDVIVFEKPTLRKLGQVMKGWPEKWEKTTDIAEGFCFPFDMPVEPPEPKGYFIGEVMYWADFGLPENYKDMIVDIFPIPDGIKKQGAYSLYYGLKDYFLARSGRSNTMFLLGDNGYLGGNENQAKIADAIEEYSLGKISKDRTFPIIGNHDVNSPSECADREMDFGACFFGDNGFLGNSNPTKGLDEKEWVRRWLDGFPSLKGGTVVIPESGSGTNWRTPYRYNIELGQGSSVYYIVGLVAGTKVANFVGPYCEPNCFPYDRRPPPPPPSPETVPARLEYMTPGKDANGEGEQIECNFLRDSIAHGSKMGKKIFIYLTHDGPSPVHSDVTVCPEVFKKLDIWLYGHMHYMGLSAEPGQRVRQDPETFPVRFLLGNGGFDEGWPNDEGISENAVSFVTMREYKESDRVVLYFQAWDTGISATNCPRKALHLMNECWQQLLETDGVHGRKAIKSKENFHFTFEAPL